MLQTVLNKQLKKIPFYHWYISFIIDLSCTVKVEIFTWGIFWIASYQLCKNTTQSLVFNLRIALEVIMFSHMICLIQLQNLPHQNSPCITVFVCIICISKNQNFLQNSVIKVGIFFLYQHQHHKWQTMSIYIVYCCWSFMLHSSLPKWPMSKEVSRTQECWMFTWFFFLIDAKSPNHSKKGHKYWIRS